jgi:hypothetical protein
VLLLLLARSRFRGVLCRFKQGGLLHRQHLNVPVSLRRHSTLQWSQPVRLGGHRLRLVLPGWRLRLRGWLLPLLLLLLLLLVLPGWRLWLFVQLLPLLLGG